MKKVLHTICIILLIAISSCSDQSPERDNTLRALPADSIAASQAPAISLPVVNNPAPQPATAALNPEHGQPGHRCDIAVGAPLNTPVTNQSAVPAPQPRVLPSQGNSSGSVTLNPPHGQPGHDCAIPVGQPLKS